MLHVVYGDVLAERDHRDRLSEIEHRLRIEEATSSTGRRPILRSTVALASEFAMRTVALMGRRRAARVASNPAFTNAEPGVPLGADDVARA